MALDAFTRVVSNLTPASVHGAVETDAQKAERAEARSAISTARLVAIAGVILGIALVALGILLCAKGALVGILPLVIGVPLVYFCYNTSVMMGNVHKELETAKQYNMLKAISTSPLDDSKRAELRKVLLPGTIGVGPLFNFSADLIASRIKHD